MVGSSTGVEVLPLAATMRTFLLALNQVGVGVPVVIAIAIAHYAATLSRVDWKRVLWLSSPTVVTALWVEALSNLMQIHLAPSSRSAAMALAIALAAAVITMDRRPSVRELWAQLETLRAQLPLFRSRRAD